MGFCHGFLPTNPTIPCFRLSYLSRPSFNNFTMTIDYPERRRKTKHFHSSQVWIRTCDTFVAEQVWRYTRSDSIDFE
ncbi:hypothetical protein GYMLUDRAFT_377026 [Collybiopsis luxurians FD-317 M1]|uniref:Uncharacterized protein n=1 Tax=Collybiopsis luxurians FD-317 M1 TaxID=944289 RepID=A0A0D0CAN3_9AGAR|nr:hypothetical protein GYMLUDRAFT_377026 [Collybiopsis luxurians FD-317 M1]